MCVLLMQATAEEIQVFIDLLYTYASAAKPDWGLEEYGGRWEDYLACKWCLGWLDQLSACSARYCAV